MQETGEAARESEEMDTDEAVEGPSDEEDDDEDEDEDQDLGAIDHILHNQPAINPHRPRRNIGRTPVLRRDRITNPSWHWGTGGHRLVGDEHEDQPQVEQEAEQREGKRDSPTFDVEAHYG